VTVEVGLPRAERPFAVGAQAATATPTGPAVSCGVHQPGVVGADDGCSSVTRAEVGENAACAIHSPSGPWSRPSSPGSIKSCGLHPPRHAVARGTGPPARRRSLPSAGGRGPRAGRCGHAGRGAAGGCLVGKLRPGGRRGRASPDAHRPWPVMPARACGGAAHEKRTCRHQAAGGSTPVGSTGSLPCRRCRDGSRRCGLRPLAGSSALAASSPPACPG
jgi:hypothetical protein